MSLRLLVTECRRLLEGGGSRDSKWSRQAAALSQNYADRKAKNRLSRDEKDRMPMIWGAKKGDLRAKMKMSQQSDPLELRARWKGKAATGKPMRPNKPMPNEDD